MEYIDIRSEIDELKEYYKNQWSVIDKTCLDFSSTRIRTNNGVESFHSQFIKDEKKYVNVTVFLHKVEEIMKSASDKSEEKKMDRLKRVRVYDKKDHAIKEVQRQLEKGHICALSALDIIGYVVKSRTQEEVNQVINSWRKGELKTLEEENRNLMEEAGLIEAIHTKSPTMEEERHEEENVDEDEYEGNDEEETQLNEDEKEGSNKP